MATAKFGGIFFEIWLSKRDNAFSIANFNPPVGLAQSQVLWPGSFAEHTLIRYIFSITYP
jgi:hypothetical protein